MSGLYMLIGTLIALGVLVTVHEYGHFWVARRCGVKVLRFSVGFGTPLLRWHDRHGTEFVIAAIPLGGYVKMLDGRETELNEAEQAQAFNLKTVQQRMAIVVAGPVANFMLAFIFFWLLALLGTEQIRPVIGQVQPDSLAQAAGLVANQEITAIDGAAVAGWGDVNIKLLQRIGESGNLQVDAKHPGTTASSTYHVALVDWQKGAHEVNPMQALGVTPWRPETAARLSHFDLEGPAHAAGLQEHDLIVAIDEQPMASWFTVVEYIQQRPEQTLVFSIERNGSELQLPITLVARGEAGARQGYLGAGVAAPEWPEEMRVHRSYGPVAGAFEGVKRTWQMSSMTLVSIKKMLFGELSAKNLSGPISIAKVAGASAESGVRSFLNFMAYLSISLGVLNLLPVPVLDGGHLLFYSLEWVRGKPLSERIQALGMQVGIALVMGLMFFAIFNDIARL